MSCFIVGSKFCLFFFLNIWSVNGKAATESRLQSLDPSPLGSRAGLAPPEAWSPRLPVHLTWITGAHILEPLPVAFSAMLARSCIARRQLRFELASVWDASVPSGRLTC